MMPAPASYYHSLLTLHVCLNHNAPCLLPHPSASYYMRLCGVDTTLTQIHAKRVTLMVQDIKLAQAQRIRGRFDPGHWCESVIN